MSEIEILLIVQCGVLLAGLIGLIFYGWYQLKD